jgi:hypothetical protein
MKAALFTGIFVLLLLATPTDTLALGLAEYGQEVGNTNGPVLKLARPDAFGNLFGEWQARFSTFCFREVMPLFCRVFQALLAAVLLTGYWLHRGQSLKRYVVKARRSIGHSRMDTNSKGLLSA